MGAKRHPRLTATVSDAAVCSRVMSINAVCKRVGNQFVRVVMPIAGTGVIAVYGIAVSPAL